MNPTILMTLALCALVVVVAGSSLRKRQGQGLMPHRQKGVIIAMLVIVGVMLTLFVFRQQ